MKRIIYFILVISLGLSCGVPKSKHSALQQENINLREEINALKSKVNEIDYLSNYSQVVLPGTELKEINSKINGQIYKIKIQLPRDYHQNTDEYPVLYVTDAETNFGGVGYIVQRLIKDKLIPPMIVVGIAYGTDYKSFYELRSRDLTPVEDSKLEMGKKNDPTGGAPAFCKFIEEELFPLIEKEYRVNPDSRSIYGHSYGGLFASYVLLKESHLFNNYLILSPSLWYKNEFMIQEADLFSTKLTPTRVYMGSGELEGRIDDLQTKFASRLKAKQHEGLFIKDEVLKNETHRTIFGAGFTNGMRFLFE